MNALADSIFVRLNDRGLCVDKALFMEGIFPRLQCLPSSSEIAVWDADTLMVKVMEVVAAVPHLSLEILDKSADLPCTATEQADGVERMDQAQADEEKKADSDAFQKAIEEAAKKIEQSDATKLRLPRFQRQGSSWTLNL